ncbi:glycoside hydrolase family 19 protein [Acinetobacter pollinis]|uniref:Glycoside hydrolase family 19 n=1 Tax=Acinetobacter pollinis TaxID=2605270 RepID=A0ABU6DTD8_9GAMM|nr:glycoside hydrolase family 19 [Acinetobacter pollinis]MEB5477119.1 glycoside hydrolase family 19 [Acinetobacter pollinis]
MSDSHIAINILVVDSNNKAFKGFPLKGHFSHKPKQRLKICNESGIYKLLLNEGDSYQIDALKPDGSYQKKILINATPDLNNSTQKITLDDPMDVYVATLTLTVNDISSPPQIVPKAQIKTIYREKERIRDTNDSGVLKLRVLIGEPLQFQLIDPLSKQPMGGTHIDEIIARKMNTSIIVIQPSIQIQSHFGEDKPNTTTPPMPQNDMNITMAQMKKMWPDVKDVSKMQVIIDELNNGLIEYKLDTWLRQAHFMAQVRAESGRLFKLRENIASYTEKNLLNNMGYYKKHKIEAKIDAEIKDKVLKEKTICNKAYMDVNRGKKLALGNVQDGDGYRFIGRGMKQLTGRYNYTQFNKFYKKAWPKEELNFVENPELIEQPKYAARTALVYWLANKLYNLADKGATHEMVDLVTKGVNAGATDQMKAERRGLFDQAKAIFKDTRSN